MWQEWRRVAVDIPCSALQRCEQVALLPSSALCSPACLVRFPPESFIMCTFAAGAVVRERSRAYTSELDVITIFTCAYCSTNYFAADIACGNILHISSEHVLHTATPTALIYPPVNSLRTAT